MHMSIIGSIKWTALASLLFLNLIEKLGAPTDSGTKVYADVSEMHSSKGT